MLEFTETFEMPEFSEYVFFIHSFKRVPFDQSQAMDLPSRFIEFYYILYARIAAQARKFCNRHKFARMLRQLKIELES